MFSIAVIIFREIFEVAIILSVLAAATRSIKDRGRWISIGLAGGVFGSLIVAWGADAISQMAEGMGQELFNASVLIMAALCVFWTVVWMSRYGRHLTQHFKEIGMKVSSGEKPLYALAVVVLLAVLREGSEMVLYSYGVIASGERVIRVLLGIIIGLLAGTTAGFGLYFGLIKISPKKVFSVTSWLLIFLASSMVSQASGLLNSAGYIPFCGMPLWDTAHIIPEKSIIGMLLHSLVGYTQRPSGIELLSFAVSFALILVVLRLYGTVPPPTKNASGSRKVFTAVIFLFIAILGFSSPALAIPKVYYPYVEKGELELEAEGSYDFDDEEENDGRQQQKYAVGYGFTSHWFSELYGKIEKVPEEKENFEFTALEWENRFQLFEPGQLWVDMGLYTAYETSFEKDAPDEVEWKLLFAKQMGKTSHAANFIFKKDVGGHSEKQLEAGFSWSSRWRFKPFLEPGLEYHVDAGELRESIPYNTQEHLLGPVVYGKLGQVKYDVGYLFGISDAAPEGVLKWILEYEIPL